MDMESAVEDERGYAQLKQLAEATSKMEHASWPDQPTVVFNADQETLSDMLDAHSHVSPMSMGTSVAPQQSEGSQGTSSKTTELSSHTSPELTESDIKHEVDLEMEVDQPAQYQDGPVNGLGRSFIGDELRMQEPQRLPDMPGPTKRRRISSKTSQLNFTNFRARTSITAENLPREELARQSIEAALASRLNPYSLHPDEYKLLRHHITRAQVTIYLNVRNRILRQWVRNPLVSVTPEEAAGCAPEERYLSLAQVAYDWLVRKGYVNFGCVEVPDFTVLSKRIPKIDKQRKRIVVVGAGMAGLGCARQLEGLFNHYRQRWVIQGQEPPEVVILEGRARLGGRIYSAPLKNQNTSGLPPDARATAEMGAHIITGFDHGNPLNMLVRGQLAIPYYALKDNSKLYDIDGRIVDSKRDRMAERLFNDVLERASAYRNRLRVSKTLEGDRDLIEAGKDPFDESGETVAAEEDALNQSVDDPGPLRLKSDQVPVGMDKLTGKAHMASGQPAIGPPVDKAEAIGFQAAENQQRPQELDLDKVAHAGDYPTLGQVMDEGVKQYQSLLHLTPQDLRLINWHFANLEYANAANVRKLSLGGWDQDIGNEFEGEHAQVIGGYIQVPRGLWQAPNELDLRTRKAVQSISYAPDLLGVDDDETVKRMTYVTCSDGEKIDCDRVVLTAPLGVLKSGSISFEPPLPDWKQQSINKLGFGTLNKLVLVFDQPFWDVERDMIGLLRDTPISNSEDQGTYTTNRGRFYLFWNCMKTTGRPVLIALMAGDAAHQAEARHDSELVLEVLHQLAKMFKQDRLPVPTETIVTRWGKDKFARGSYSYVGPEAHSDDYDMMAKKVGNLYFAGEATCGTHPATVHGAYISGLRAAADVIEDLLGPIEIAQPLVPPVIKLEPPTQAPPAVTSTAPLAIPQIGHTTPSLDRQALLHSFEADIIKAIVVKLGHRPDKPEKVVANPFLLYSKDKWLECKAACDAQRQAIVRDPSVKASRNEVRAALGKMWREASDEVKRPYIEQTEANRANNKDTKTTFQERLEKWDTEAIAIRRDYIRDHPDVLSEREEQDMWHALGVFGGQDRKAKLVSGYAE